MSACPVCGQNAGDHCQALVRAAERVADLEAQCAAMRFQLEQVKGAFGAPLSPDTEPYRRGIELALTTDAGKALLERLENTEAELAKLKSMTLHEVLEPDRIRTRAKALEDAAKVAEDWPRDEGFPSGMWLGEHIAAAIRALKDGGT